MASDTPLLRRIEQKAFRELLARLYCCGIDETDIQVKRLARLLSDFSRQFGAREGMELFSAPGRTEIGGNHTDHQHGCVVAGSVNLDIAAVAAPNKGGCIRMISDAAPSVTVALDDLRPNPDERFTSAALIRGIASRFAGEGYAVGGFDLVADSTVLKGSGLSSSAAFEVLVGAGINSLFCGGKVSAVDVAKFGQYAENVYFGKPCGLMDQLASSVGGFLFIDFAEEAAPRVEKISFDLAAHRHALCIVDSGADHADLSDVYAAIPEEMARVAAFFGKTHLREVAPDAMISSLPSLRKAAGDRAVLRALHFFKDNQRAIDEASALKAGRFDDFLALIRDSGRSSAEYLQNTHVPGSDREQAVDVALALCGELLGKRGAYRVHGGGFAGTVQAFVPFDLLELFITGIDAALGGGSCHVLSIRPEGGIRLL